MAIKKQKKEDIVRSLKKIAADAATLVFVNFHGLPVAEITAIRKKLKGVEIGYLVAKKTLIRIALGSTNIAGTLPELPGEIAMTYGQDQIAPAREIYEFQKKNPERLKIVGGVFEGKYISAAEMTTIAAIPGREVLYGQFVNLINSSIQGLVIALSEISKQKETTGATA